jgi:hypothetical protein
MINDQFQVSLIEINTNPDITICCNLLQRIIPTMIDNAFRIAVDSVFCPPDFIVCKKLNKFY